MAEEARFAPRIVTATVTGWARAQRFLATVDSSVAAACLQETWIEQPKLDVAQSWGMRRGWQLALSPAATATVGGLSGGTAVCVRSPFGLRFLEGEDTFALAPSRVAATTIEAPGFLACSCFSLHLRAGANWPEQHRRLLATVGVAAASQLARATVAGDMDMPPQLVRTSGFPARVILTSSVLKAQLLLHQWAAGSLITSLCK